MLQGVHVSQDAQGWYLEVDPDELADKDPPQLASVLTTSFAPPYGNVPVLWHLVHAASRAHVRGAQEEFPAPTVPQEKHFAVVIFDGNRLQQSQSLLQMAHHKRHAGAAAGYPGDVAQLQPQMIFRR